VVDEHVLRKKSSAAAAAAAAANKTARAAGNDPTSSSSANASPFRKMSASAISRVSSSNGDVGVRMDNVNLADDSGQLSAAEVDEAAAAAGVRMVRGKHFCKFNNIINPTQNVSIN
jgi:hypothetical protein